MNISMAVEYAVLRAHGYEELNHSWNPYSAFSGMKTWHSNNNIDLNILMGSSLLLLETIRYTQIPCSISIFTITILMKYAVDRFSMENKNLCIIENYYLWSKNNWVAKSWRGRHFCGECGMLWPQSELIWSFYGKISNEIRMLTNEMVWIVSFIHHFGPWISFRFWFGF